MKPVAFDYERPTTLSDAAMLLGQANGFSKVLAGGQSLGPMLNLRLAQPELLVDITSIAELTAVDDSQDHLEIGACVTHANIEDGRIPDHFGGLLQRVAGRIAYRAVRNRGTVGGSLAHADPAADWLSALSLAGADATIATPRGSRTVAVADLVLSSFTTVIRPDEIIRSVRIPKFSAGARWGFYKFSQKAGEFAHAIGGVLHDPARGRFRAVIGAIETAPIVVADASALFGGTFRPDVAEHLDEPAVLQLARPTKRQGRVYPKPRAGGLEARGQTGGRTVKALSLTINGRNVKAEVAPRLNLADFLREHQALTATHVGCEHGVCGACTILIDGAPARSCITFAAAANGAEITTLEGFESDPVMALLREAFAENHGLQCGFCTPGMLMTGRDIITRLPDADEKRIRLELSGNLCRCTGYVGIVKAIQSAQAAASKAGLARQSASRGIGPVGSHPPAGAQDYSQRPAASARTQPVAAPAENFGAIDWPSVEREGVELHQSFSVPFPRDQVWRFFADLDQVASCMPGARLTGPMTGNRAEGEVNVKLGPIVSAFHGVLDVARDDSGLPRNRARRRPGRQEPVQRAGDHHLHCRFPDRGRIPGRRLGQVPAERCASAIQPLGARQRRRRPSDAGVCAKSRSPAVRQAARIRERRYSRCRRRRRDRRSSVRIAAFFRRLFGG